MGMQTTFVFDYRIAWGWLCFLLFFVGCATNTDAEKSETAGLHLQIATEYIRNENYPLALKELMLAEELDPRNPAVQANLGLVYFMRERYALSEKHYKKAIAIKPDFTDAKNNLGRVYVEIGNYAQAEILLKEVLADLTYVDFSKAQANYGILEFKRQRHASAIVYLKRALERDRESCYTRVYLGRSYLELKEIDMASSQLDKAVPFCQQIASDEAHFYSAIALYRKNEKEKAKFRFEELIRLFPSGYNVEKAQKMLELVKKDVL